MTGRVDTIARPGDLLRVRRALLSVSDRTGLEEFARALRRHGVELVATGGTAAALGAAGLPARPVEEVTGFPEMMGGRVKTLHPLIHGALLARRGVASDREALAQHDIAPIDLVCVNLYPFERTVGAGSASDAEAIEQIDIGGPALLRSAAKNHASVVAVTSPRQYARVTAEMDAHQGATTFALRAELAAAAFARTAAYDATIAAWMAARGGEAFPEELGLAWQRVCELRYGENPHQRAALYRDPVPSGRSVVGAEFQGGKELSYNNVADAAAALELIDDLDALDPRAACAAIVKHAIPCGAAAAARLRDAVILAHEGDPAAAYGGILAASRAVHRETAEGLAEGATFLEVIVAPGIDPEACSILSRRWPNVRLLAVGGRGAAASRAGRALRWVPGGLLVQERDTEVAQPDRWTHAAGPAPDQPTRATAAFTWTVAKHLRSNAVAIGRDLRLVGAGAGQVDRLWACRIAVEKAAGRIGAGSVAASDAFFPFPDGPQVLVDAGVTCIVHPGGSKRDRETLDLCDRRGVTCLLTGVRHFRH